jgi:hypothetical protein
MSEAGQRGLPDGWQVTVTERSVGVFEVKAIDPYGRAVTTVGTDVDQEVSKVATAALKVQAEVDQRPPAGAGELDPIGNGMSSRSRRLGVLAVSIAGLASSAALAIAWLISGGTAQWLPVVAVLAGLWGASSAGVGVIVIHLVRRNRRGLGSSLASGSIGSLAAAVLHSLVFFGAQALQVPTAWFLLVPPLAVVGSVVIERGQSKPNERRTP